MTNSLKHPDDSSQLRRALVALKEMRAKLESIERARTEPIAIIGMGCRFPGGADDPEKFWQLLRNGVNTVTEVPADRWDVDAYYDPDPTVPGKMYTRYGNFLKQVDQFDPIFFGIAPREAASMDPQQRLFLEVTWEALEYAGLAPDRLAGSQTGVFMGLSNLDYFSLLFADIAQIDHYRGTGGNSSSILAARLSYLLDLYGPSLVLDTACSSSLVTVHLACQSLRNRESDLALAGGVNVILVPDRSISISKHRMLSPDGCCKAFDAAADGYARGEGCGVVVLKRLSDALADGDNILALIRGSAVNHDGRSNGLSAPNGLAQEALIREALANAGVDPAQVSYIEAHGTGTSLGDPIEMHALEATFCQGRSKDNPLLIGSVKTNIGHLESAAGVAGLIKTVLSLQHKAIPAHLHLKEPNPHIPWEKLPVSIPTELILWPAQDGPRIAGVSSFGMGGANAHMIVAEAPSVKVAKPEVERPSHLLNLSAKSKEALTELVARHEQYLASHPEASLADIGFTANIGRTHFSHRLAILAESTEQARDKLAAFSTGQRIPGIISGIVEETESPEVAFLFTGQGSQYVGMGRQLYETQPTFRKTLDHCDELLRPYLEQPLLSVIYPEADGPSLLDETAYTQPALFALEYALAELWRSWGIEPAAVMGHSVGEYVAACLAGVFSLEDGLKLIAERGRLMQGLPKEGMMASVQATEAEILAAMGPYAASVSIAAINGPRSIVLSGERQGVQALLKQFEAKGVKTQSLVVSHAFHSPLMEPILDSFEQVARQVTFNAPRIPLISNLTGRMMASAEIPGPTYWRRHIREAVRFADTIATLHEQNYKLFLEVGPSPTLLGMARHCVPEGAGVWLPSLRKGRDDWQQLLTSLGTLYVNGVVVDGAGFDQDYPRRRVMLPTYPFQRQRYWFREEIGYDERKVTTPSLMAENQQDPILHPLLGRRLRSYLKEIQFENQISCKQRPFLTDHQLYGTIIVPGAAFMEMGLAAASAAFGPGRYRLENVAIQEPLILAQQGAKTVQVILTPESEAQATFELASLKGNDEWRVHAKGTINMLDSTGSMMLDSVSLKTIQERFQNEIDVDEFYERLRELGLDYGQYFQGVVRLWRGDGEMLGQVRLPEALETAAEDYYFHPALLDACFHPGLLHCTLPSLGVARSETEKVEEHIYIPIGLERFEIYHRPPSQVWSHISVRPDQSENRDLLKADARFFDEEGQLVAEVVSMYLKRAPREALLRAIQPNFNDWLYQIIWEPKVRAEATEAAQSRFEQPGNWLIFTDQIGVGIALADRLQVQGEHCVLVRPGEAYRVAEAGQWQINPTRPDDFDRLLRDALPANGWRGLIYLWSMDAASPSETDIASLEETLRLNCDPILHLVQALARAEAAGAPRLWLATLGAQPVGNGGHKLNPAQATVWGLSHTIALEFPNLHCVRVDLEPGPVNNNVPMLFEEIWSPDGEDRIAFRSGNRYVARLVGSAARTKDKPQPPDWPFELDMTERGVLDNLVLRPATRRPPGPGEVEIRVRATGLNFRDVLKALDRYPGPPGSFGDECSGDVVAVGEGVEHLQVGDKVFGMAPGSFSQYVTTSADFVVRKPEQLSYEEAATIPVTFATAYYALHHLGKISAGERVLIHAAAGGVGMAAVQLAHRAGAEVLGTASPSKWDFLRSMGVKHTMNSRTLDFADEVMSYTDGQGVDLVLNSLTGEFIPKSLSVMTDKGRFLEIGRSGIWDESQVAELKPEASYYLIFLDEVCRQEPALLQSIMLELMEAFKDGTLKPLPHHLFPIEHVSDAFRFMAQARHMGKIVVTQPVAGSDYALETAGDTLLRSDATYLITGGLGGLGLTTAQWMAAQGAQHLVLIGRRPPSEAAQEVLNRLEQAGVEVIVAKGDISQQSDVSRILSQISHSLPPLRGIIHTAGVLDDGILLEQNWDRFARVMAPKVDGSWYLHALTRNLPLDFFVLFSSVTSVLGSAGQANYVAANAFMDVLAAQRHLQGRPALSISWGPWAEVGMIAGLESRVQQRWAKQGISLILPEQGTQVLEQVLQGGSPPHVTAIPADWSAYSQMSAGTDRPPLLAKITHKTPSVEKVKKASAQEPELLRVLAEAAPNKRQNIVIDHIREQARLVFGLAPDYPIDRRQSFNELGLDSLMAVELRNALSNSAKVALPATLLFDYPTLETLADYLVHDVLALETMEEAVDKSALEYDEQAQMVAELERISDNEAEALLMDELLNISKREMAS